MGSQVICVALEDAKKGTAQIGLGPQVDDCDSIAGILIQFRQLLLEGCRRGKEQAAERYQDRHPVRLQYLWRILLNGELTILEDPFLDRDLVRLFDDEQNNCQGDANEHRILQRDQQGECEGDEHNELLHSSRPPDHLDVIDLQCPIANDHQQASQSRHGYGADRTAKEKQRDRDCDSGKDVTESRFGAAAFDQRGRRQ